MPEAPAAPAAPAAPTAPAPKPGEEAPKPGAAAPEIDPATGKPKVEAPAAPNPYEFELEVGKEKKKVAFKGREQLVAVLQKAIYADQMTKNATQALAGAKAIVDKLALAKKGDWSGLREMANDPEVGFDVKRFALDLVKEMMEEEKLSPEAREAKELRAKVEKFEKEEADRKANAEAAARRDRVLKDAAVVRTKIVEAFKAFPDLPVNQSTMDGVIQNMKVAGRLLAKKYGKPLSTAQLMAEFPPSKAVELYAKTFWAGIAQVVQGMTPEQISKRFGEKTLENLEKHKLKLLKEQTRPGGRAPASPPGEGGGKKNLTQKEFERSQGLSTAGL